MVQEVSYGTCARHAMPRNTCEDGLALVRPMGRRLWHSGDKLYSRKIEFPLPDEKTKRRIFGIHTGLHKTLSSCPRNAITLSGKMTLAEDVDLEEYIMSKVIVDHAMPAS